VAFLERFYNSRVVIAGRGFGNEAGAAVYPNGVDAALDLVGTPTLPDTLRSVRVHGTACIGGSLSNQWTVRDF
jgi:NADPH:quinone reductase-like Zn-dependent oxidoreductase